VQPQERRPGQGAQDDLRADLRFGGLVLRLARKKPPCGSVRILRRATQAREAGERDDDPDGSEKGWPRGRPPRRSRRSWSDHGSVRFPTAVVLVAVSRSIERGRLDAARPRPLTLTWRCTGLRCGPRGGDGGRTGRAHTPRDPRRGRPV
jgi:hypothetical protein